MLNSEAELHRKIDLLIKAETTEPLRKQLNEVSEVLKERSEEMWNLVFAEIGAAGSL